MLGSLGRFRGAPWGGRCWQPHPDAYSRAWLPRWPVESQKHANPRGTKGAEPLLQNALLPSNCASGAASTRDLPARSSLLPDLRPGAEAPGSSVRPGHGALAPPLHPTPTPPSRTTEGTEARWPLRSRWGRLKDRVQPTVNLPSPCGFFPSPRPPRTHPALPSCKRSDSCTLNGTREGLPSLCTNVACQPERGFQTHSAHRAFRRPERRQWARWRSGAKWLSVPVRDGTGQGGRGPSWLWGWGGDGGAERPGNDPPTPLASAANCNFKGGLGAV